MERRVEYIPFDELTPSEQFEMREGVNPEIAYLHICKEGGFPEYCLEYGKYEFLAFLSSLQEYFEELEDFRKCADIRPLKAGLLKYLFETEFPADEEE